MYLRYSKIFLFGVVVWFIIAAPNRTGASEAEDIVPIRNIPGITADDMFPSGCVSCHLNFPDRNMDTRISTLMVKLAQKVGPELLAHAQAAAPKDVKLTGKHPAAEESLADIPKLCIECHNSRSQTAPSFAQMIHLVHLTGGQNNHYMTLFQGECTNCHKLNLNTGEWVLPSGSE
jgi:hypothetical protein